jgi:hypothetical protein
MKELIARINKGDYKLDLYEPVLVETGLFLSACLRSNEQDRIEGALLQQQPFVTILTRIEGKDAYENHPMVIEKDSYLNDLQ